MQHPAMPFCFMAQCQGCCSFTGRLKSACLGVLRVLWCCVQSFLTLYTSCVRELLQLLKGCAHVHPVLEDPAAPFVTATETRIQSLVRPHCSRQCQSTCVL